MSPLASKTLKYSKSASKKLGYTFLGQASKGRPVYEGLMKGLIYLVLTDPQEFFQQHLIKKEEQPSFEKRYSMHFGEESALLLFA